MEGKRKNIDNTAGKTSKGRYFLESNLVICIKHRKMYITFGQCQVIININVTTA